MPMRLGFGPGQVDEPVRGERVAVKLGAGASISDSCLKQVRRHRALLSNQILRGIPVYTSGKKSSVSNRCKSRITFS